MKQKKLKNATVFLSFIFMLSWLFFAKNIFAEVESTGWSLGLQNAGGFGLPESTVFSIITTIASWLLSIIGIVAIISFVISGFQYFMTGVDEKAAEKAKKAMTASIIGVIVAICGLVVISAANNLLSGSSF